MTSLREQQGILEQAPTKHKAVLFVNVKVCVKCVKGGKYDQENFRAAATLRV